MKDNSDCWVVWEQFAKDEKEWVRKGSWKRTREATRRRRRSTLRRRDIVEIDFERAGAKSGCSDKWETRVVGAEQMNQGPFPTAKGIVKEEDVPPK